MTGRKIDQDQHREQEFASKVAGMNAWRNLLRDDREKAETKAREAIKEAQKGGVFSTWELSKFFAQMMNGCAAPEDFSTSRCAS